ncbi:autotransporter domain-containing protein [Erythrobacteraceae bacterium CFH 75059]|uniref:autotransporter domain-containing protein n=1 Tax=Qipengyuania thermophila TaxID=2509361 RepID=UPI001021DF2A|nr:autotransporter domain-containing protein [Qipengyuania thermophila]TCD01878.1 autotransporter domain-containing protein [Erythrobacteraceae bacterium CFH 75059]
MRTPTTVRSLFLAATSCFALALPSGAMAQGAAPAAGHAIDSAARGSVTDVPDLGEDRSAIITRDDISPVLPAPGGSLDSGVNGVGQMVVRANPANFSLGLCTGTLINPRTVIFAAHCVNTRPAEAYGQPTGGVPISFGFGADNLPAVRRWLGLDGGTLYATDTARAIFNVEHVWYDPRSLNGGFLQADVAMATLDTPAFDIPTWAMLFTPLTGQEHVTVTGYGGNGTNALGNRGIDYRRRTAENYVSFLGSLADRNEFLFGARSGFEQNLYMSSFSDPAGVGAYNPAAGRFDFGLFGPNDVALPREGTTAGGDSGGPLIVDQKYDRAVIIGVLSGGSRFFGAQQFHNYGTHSFYQPLHSFWQQIVANNPYVYATTRGGAGQWTDPGHWIQAMDPNYLVDLDGRLINRLPNAPGDEVSGTGAKFGDICFLTECEDFTRPVASNATGPEFFVAGGPGTQNFVPNNVRANPQLGIRPRYFDVTLSAGRTTLSGANITIDRLTLNGPAILDIAASGSLRSLGDWTQIAGWTNVDGTLSAREAFVLSGLVSGTGTIRAPFFTSVSGVIAPGGADRIGTLTIDGNAILASGAALFIDAGRAGADRLNVTGVLSLSDAANPAATGASVVFNKAPGAAPRHGDSFVIASAAGGVEGQFGRVFSFQGVLRPELRYTANTVVAELRAGALVEIIGRNNPTARAFGAALDTLREGSYGALFNLYGAVDLMDPVSLTAALDSLAPRTIQQGRTLMQQQGNALFNAVGDRLSVMGTAGTGTLSIVGSPLGIMGAEASGMGHSPQMSFAGLTPGGTRSAALPEGVSGFVSGGMTSGQGAAGVTNRVEDGMRSTFFGMGLEHEVAPNFTLGMAAGHAQGVTIGGTDEARSSLGQMALYGSYQLGDGAYVGLAANLDQARIRTTRAGFGTGGSFGLFGEQDLSRITAVAETGVNVAMGGGLIVTPRAQLSHQRTRMSGFTETGGEAALAVEAVTLAQTDARLGVKLSGSRRLAGGWTFVPQLQADYVRVLGGGDAGLNVRFAAADHLAIALPVAGGDTDWAEVRGGLGIDNGTVRFGVGVESSIGRSDLRNDRAVADVTFRF